MPKLHAQNRAEITQTHNATGCAFPPQLKEQLYEVCASEKELSILFGRAVEYRVEWTPQASLITKDITAQW